MEIKTTEQLQIKKIDEIDRQDWSSFWLKRKWVAVDDLIDELNKIISALKRGDEIIKVRGQGIAAYLKGWKPARELLKEAKRGNIIKFDDGVEGVVIEGYKIDENCVIDDKAILLTKFSDGDFWGKIAYGYLGVPARIKGGDENNRS